MTIVDIRRADEDALLPVLGGGMLPAPFHPGRKTAQEVSADYFGAKIANDDTRAT